MQQRFQNPHPAGGHMRVGHQQQMQPMQQMQQMPQAGGAIPLPNGMVMLPNGMVVTPQQAQALIGGMNPNMNNGIPMNNGVPMTMNMMPMPGGMMPMQGGMPTNTGRFGNQNQTVSGTLTSTASFEGDTMSDSRFQSNTSMGQSMEQASSTVEEQPTSFSISVTKGVKFNGNSKVVLNSYYEEVKANQIFVRENNITLADCFGEAVESCIDYAHDEGTGKLITVANFIVENRFYKAAEQEQFNKLILDNDIKAMYKAVKSAWPTLNHKYDIHMFDRFDTIMTDAINDFIAVNCPVEVHIDSFMADFNELLKFLRNVEGVDLDLEDELINHMNNFINSIKQNLEQLDGIEQDGGTKVTYIPEQHMVAYVDKYSHELGVVEMPEKLTKIEDNAINVFLLSSAKAILAKEKAFTVYMVTIDKIVMQLTKALNGEIFIKKV